MILVGICYQEQEKADSKVEQLLLPQQLIHILEFRYKQTSQ